MHAHTGISIDRGYQQITTEFLPIRQQQLGGYLYGPGGTRPLLPQGQPDKVCACWGDARGKGAWPRRC
jgi:hypothetical protein